jgi:CheY-like chemotaxis protein
MKLKSLVILHAEDDANDVLLLRRTISRLGVEHRFFYVNNGEEAIQNLRGDGPYANRDEYPFPTMLIVDLKMPRKGVSTCCNGSRTILTAMSSLLWF